MALKISKLVSDELRIGMYVSKLDRPWLETPFLMQGFLIKSDDDIKQLKKFCRHVYIDEELSKEPLTKLDGSASEKVKALLKDTNSTSKRKYSRDDLKKLFPNKSLKVYEAKTDLKEELATAKIVFKDLSHSISDMMTSIRRGGTIQVSAVKDAVNPMVSSIIRNPDACIWLARMKSRDSYTYKHSMGASVWAVALGRQIGLPPADLKTLAVGTLLCDIGKLKLPPELLEKEEILSADEIELMHSHVDLSLKELANSAGVNEDIINIVAAHHERFNGQGYPKGLAGNEIPIMARIAAIADSYDAMTSQRTYSKAKSPVIAVKELYELRGDEYQPELIEEFIQAVGLYPAGTLIELSTGEVAVVVSENKMRRLRPKILKLLDSDKKPIRNSAIINLMDVTHDADDNSIEITQSLEPGAYGINPEAIYF